MIVIGANRFKHFWLVDDLAEDEVDDDEEEERGDGDINDGDKSSHPSSHTEFSLNESSLQLLIARSFVLDICEST